MVIICWLLVLLAFVALGGAALIKYLIVFGAIVYLVKHYSKKK